MMYLLERSYSIILSHHSFQPVLMVMINYFYFFIVLWSVGVDLVLGPVTSVTFWVVAVYGIVALASYFGDKFVAEILENSVVSSVGTWFGNDCTFVSDATFMVLTPQFCHFSINLRISILTKVIHSILLLFFNTHWLNTVLLFYQLL